MSTIGPKLIDPNSITKTWSEKEILAPGIVVYKNVLKKDIEIIDKIESNGTNVFILIGQSISSEN